MLVVINKLMGLLQPDPFGSCFTPELSLISRNQSSNPVFLAITPIIIFSQCLLFFTFTHTANLKKKLYSECPYTYLLESTFYYIVLSHIFPSLIFFNSFIKTFICNIIHLFKVYKSVVFSIFADICSHHHNQF